MAISVLTYLGQTSDMPLVLGGFNNPFSDEDINNNSVDIIGYTDASLGTAPKGRSNIGHIVKLSSTSGAIIAKSKTTSCVVTSSFESELDGASTALKSISRVRNILKELHITIKNQPILYSDNQAMIEFIKGNGIAKGVRHMELRMWYLREKVQKGDVIIAYQSGKIIPPDKLTKLGEKVGHGEFTHDIMGHGLLGAYISQLSENN
jgi:hypothetical protein